MPEVKETKKSLAMKNRIKQKYNKNSGAKRGMCAVTESTAKNVRTQKEFAMNVKGVSAAKKADTLTVKSQKHIPAVPFMTVKSVQVAPCKVSLVTAVVTALEEKITKEAEAAALNEQLMATLAANKPKAAVSRLEDGGCWPEAGGAGDGYSVKETAVNTSSAKKTVTEEAIYAVQTFSLNDVVDHNVIISF